MRAPQPRVAISSSASSSRSSPAAVTPIPMLARTAPGTRISSPREIPSNSAAVSAPVTPSRCATSGCAQNAPLRTAIPNRVASSSATARGSSPSTTNVATPDPVLDLVPHPEQLDSRNPLEAGPEPVGKLLLAVADHVHPVLGEGPACRSERHGAHRVGRPGLVAVRQRPPGDIVERDELDGPAPMEQRQPVGQRLVADDQRAHPERCVQLGPEKARKSTSSASTSIVRCGASWAASTKTRAP